MLIGLYLADKSVVILFNAKLHLILDAGSMTLNGSEDMLTI